MIGAWLFAVGASVGSFLNVVVHRLPRGMSLISPASRCPRCKTPLRAGDNVPVLGWLRLRGRCRWCGKAISTRYPWVELACGLLFVGLAGMELAAPPLPAWSHSFRRMEAATRPSNPEPRWSGFPLEKFTGHALLLTVLLTNALLVTDAARFPGRAKTILVVVALALLMAMTLQTARPTLDSSRWTGMEMPTTLFLALAGMGTAFTLSLLIGRIPGTRLAQISFGLAWIGLFLGWRGALFGFVVTLALTLGLWIDRSRRSSTGSRHWEVRTSAVTLAWGLFAAGAIAIWLIPLVVPGLLVQGKP